MIARPYCRRSALWVALAGLVLPFCAAPACSTALVRLEVYDRADGRVLEQHRSRGERYVVGEPGHEYSLRVRNVSGARVLAVVSVDGVNVVTGEDASPGQSGYVIEAGETVDVQGWRKSLEHTAAFYFTDVGDAYATRTGRPGNLGVIGVAAFRERAPPAMTSQRMDDTESRAAAKAGAAPAPATGTRAEASSDSAAAREQASVAAMDAPLGTGHGRNEYSPVRQVEFERRSHEPDQRLAIRYDSHTRLVARGILPRVYRPDRAPDPFPGTLGFVPDP